MKCPICDGTGEKGRTEELIAVCSHCNGTGEVQTNEEWLRSCTTEELAETIAERIINSHTMFEYILHQDNRRAEDLVREVREWLKEKHHAE